MINVFLLDNIDSFSYNLVDELRALKVNVKIYRNTVSAHTIFAAMEIARRQAPVILVLSPGPGSPSEAGCMPELLALCAGKFPIIGICLGHQAIVEFCGGKVVRADQVVHGKSSAITHQMPELFGALPNPLNVARYHSLIGKDLPSCLSVIAHYQHLPMAVFHEEHKMIGFQFHPESILTAQGSQLLMQTINYLTSATTPMTTSSSQQPKE
ncbi:aminodeoxychorismate/anthranilate synthase component II [Alteromonas facilis]|uniref:aminodeoxychorismate/anthranilate synthase component II n=1 Tax=Alteromonas facilis TaxID=2048004 RepID=UPI000C294276|nr:aminodeoxychorismate/anthranilate synthase component II [Alteromonas facilis]